MSGTRKKSYPRTFAAERRAAQRAMHPERRAPMGDAAMRKSEQKRVDLVDDQGRQYTWSTQRNAGVPPSDPTWWFNFIAPKNTSRLQDDVKLGDYLYVQLRGEQLEMPVRVTVYAYGKLGPRARHGQVAFSGLSKALVSYLRERDKAAGQ